jgi:YVTN family beta-propeller protein
MALLIATYQYDDSGLRKLIAPAQDAESLAAVLKDPDIAGFEVTTLINEPHHVVGEAIGTFYRDRRRDDLTLLYFTGHGLKDDDGRLYLAMTNTRRDTLLFTALSAEQIDQAMEGCASRQKVLILDCCYSGAFPAGRLAKADTEVHALERFQGRGRTVLTASDATQYSFEGNKLRGEAAQSVFTSYLVTGLRDGSADLDGDGDITLDELYSYVYERVVEELPQQRPKKQDNVEGRTIIARNINWSMPAYLRNAISSPIATDRLGAVDALAHLYRIGNETVRARALAEIQRLADDDSRSVSAAAAARLGAILPARVEPAVVEPAVVEPPAPLERPVTAPAAPGRPEVGRRRWRPSRVDLLPLVVGVMTILAAGLLVTGMVLQETAFGGVHIAGFESDHPWYAVGLATVALAAGVSTLVPRTRSLIGPGVVIGAAVTSTWGLVFYAGKVMLVPEDWGSWTETAGHLALLAAGVLAGLLVVRTNRARIELRLPRDTVARLAFGAGGVAAVAGALALAGEVHQIARVAAQLESSPSSHIGQLFSNHARAYVVAMVLALNVPLWAAIVAPRRLGLSILGGWIGGGAAIALTTSDWTPHLFGFPDQLATESTWVIVFGATLLLLVVAVGIIVRRPAELTAGSAVGTPRRRTALLAGLATVALLPAAGGVAAAVAAEPLTSAWVGTYDVAVSPDGSRVYVLTWLRPWGFDRGVEPVPGQVIVIDAARKAVVGTPIPVGDSPADLVVSPDGDYLYVANSGSNSVSVISTRENATVGGPIPVDDGPSRVYVGPDGQHVYVVNGGAGTVSKIDTTSNRVSGAPIPLGDEAGVTAVSPDGSRIYTTNGGAENGPYHVRVLDTGTGEAVGDAIPLGDRPVMMVVSQDGRRVYIGAQPDSADDPEQVWVIDTETNRTAGTPVPVDAGVLRAMAISPDGGRLYVAGYFGGVSVVDTRTGAIVGDPVDMPSAGMAVSPDGNRVYAASSETFVLVFETADPRTGTTIDIESG